MPRTVSPETASVMSDLRDRNLLSRLWDRDHTIWTPDPRDIADRLGWLDVVGPMKEQTPELRAFAEGVRQEGYRHVVTLGMGGSSLGPEALRQTFPPAPGYPELLVLDSTVSAQVAAVANQIDPARTLFLVSSKSGGTIETLSFYRYFRGLVEAASSAGGAGRKFVAITDPGTNLEALARESGFRRTFLNPADIGGRYSVLSYFGLVPAVLAGMDIDLLLDRAALMREACGPGAPVEDNPGAQLAAFLGANSARGRNKVTFVTPHPLGGFGLWAEQLIAESLGKDGKGVIPVTGEPLLDPSAYGDDRVFIYRQVAVETDIATTEAVDAIAAAGHPVMRLELKDRFDLGAEFFRWEIAAAVLGAIMGVHPFDQPDVQASKDNTDAVLDRFLQSGSLPEQPGAGSLAGLLSKAECGDYLAIMPYTAMGGDTERLLGRLRQRVMERYRVATTLGYGPRFLHSTGQLHKGGLPCGLYLQLTAPHGNGPAIPGQPYDFATLAAAQALGDYQALTNLGRRVVRIDLGDDTLAGLQELLDSLP